MHPLDVTEDYLAFLLRYKGDYSNIRIAMDLSNGMANLYAKRIFGDAPDYLFDELACRFHAVFQGECGELSHGEDRRKVRH